MDFTVLGMGLAAMGLGGVGIGLGYMFGKMLESVSRNPNTQPRLMTIMWVGFALIEAVALYGLVLAFMIYGLRK